MSRIHVEEGTAEVVLMSRDFDYTNGDTLSLYHPEDLIRATIRALRAVGTDRAAILGRVIEDAMESVS